MINYLNTIQYQFDNNPSSIQQLNMTPFQYDNSISSPTRQINSSKRPNYKINQLLSYKPTQTNLFLAYQNSVGFKAVGLSRFITFTFFIYFFFIFWIK